jgi:hypothetical protein
MGITDMLVAVVEKSPLAPLCQRGEQIVFPTNAPFAKGGHRGILPLTITCVRMQN